METKEVISQKTLELLLKKGYDGGSVSDIQQETGMAGDCCIITLEIKAGCLAKWQKNI